MIDNLPEVIATTVSSLVHLDSLQDGTVRFQEGCIPVSVVRLLPYQYDIF